MKNTILVSFGIAILLLIGFGAMFIVVKRESTQVACTMEAKICPDGSSVGRQGPQCEFTECPTILEAKTAKLGQKILNNSIYITPIEVLEDSRCPIDVVCIWAGQVRLRAKLQEGINSEEVILTLGTPSAFMSKNVTLTSVLPAKDSKKEVALTEYSFDFLVN